jgi:ribosomal protein S17E
MSDMKDYMISKNKAEEYARKLTNAEYERKKTLVKQDVILDAIVAEIRSLICEYQDSMSKDFEQCLKNLIDQIEGYKQ